MRYRLAALLAALCVNISAPAAHSEAYPAFSLFGKPKYAANFKHFDYVNPTAPKGGELRLAADGTFDSLNPFIMKGVSDERTSLMFDTLMVSSGDEIATAYGLLAEKMEAAKDKKSVTFTLRKEAVWPDGKPVTADDVVFTFDVLKKDGSPQYRTYYRDVEKAEKIDERTVRFLFSTDKNRELPLIIGELAILPKHQLEKENFAEFTDKPILGSGPYEVGSVEMGRTILFKRRKDYWGENLPVNKGRHNFDVVRVDYYRDSNVAIEALNAGQYDFRRENISKNWANSYDTDAVKNGTMIKEELPDGTPTGMQAFVFNTRRAKFADPKTREALSYLMDFEWINKNLFYDAYARNRSFFGNSPFESKGLPSKEELKLLDPFKAALPERVFTEEYQPPKTDGSGNNREQLAKAGKLLQEAGWKFTDGKWIGADGKTVLEVEFLLVSPSFERIIGPIAQSMNKIGIPVKTRMADVPQYVQRTDSFDFDIVLYWFTQGNAPGNEQLSYWHSSQADVSGSKNYAGIKSPAADALVEEILKAPDMETLKTATRALDRVLQWNFYVIPQWYSRKHRLIYKNVLGRPKKTPPYSLGYVENWWRKDLPPEEAKAEEKKAETGKEKKEGK